MVTHNNHGAAQKHATQHTPTMNVNMGFDASQQSDPIKRMERDQTSYNPNIGTINIYDQEVATLVSKFKSLDDLEREENEKCGLGSVTNAEARIYQDMCFYTSYYDDSMTFFNDARESYLEANYDSTWRYDKQTYAHYNTNSDYYIEMVESGEIEDDGQSCRMGDMRMGASLSEEEIDSARQDFGDEALDAAQEEWDAEQDQDFAEGNPNAPEATAPQPDQEQIIQSDVQLNSAFSRASSQESEPAAAKPEQPAPVVIQPNRVASNDATFQLSA